MSAKPAARLEKKKDCRGDAARRGAILRAAEKLFRHYGPLKTTIGEIAREAGIGVGSVYLEFGSKDEIVAELSTERHDLVLERMRRAAGEGPYAERLSRALEARIEALFDLARRGAHSCDLVLCNAGPVKAAHGRFRIEELAFVAELLREGARAGELAVEQPELSAELVQRAHATLSPPWLFELERQRALALCRALNDLLLDGLRAR